MIDINSRIGHKSAQSSPGNAFSENQTADLTKIALIELLFFAYRDFTAEADSVLSDYGFGRAHHRVLHFVHRHPGLSVAELLKILQVTKQSSARILKQLVDDGFIEQRPGAKDRRQRLLSANEKGKKLAVELMHQQSQRLQVALQQADPSAYAVIATFLIDMITPQNRDRVVELIGDPNLAAGNLIQEPDKINRTGKEQAHATRPSSSQR